MKNKILTILLIAICNVSFGQNISEISTLTKACKSDEKELDSLFNEFLYEKEDGKGYTYYYDNFFDTDYMKVEYSDLCIFHAIKPGGRDSMKRFKEKIENKSEGNFLVLFKRYYFIDDMVFYLNKRGIAKGYYSVAAFIVN